MTDDLEHKQQPHAVATISRAGVHKQQQATGLAGFTTAALTPGVQLSLFSDMQTTEPQHIEQQPRRWQGYNADVGFTRTLQATCLDNTFPMTSYTWASHALCRLPV